MLITLPSPALAMVRTVPPHFRHQMEERHPKTDADEYWGFLIKHQFKMAKSMEDNVQPAKLEQNLQKMLKPFRLWSGAQRRKTNGADSKGDNTDNNNRNNNNTDKGSGKGFTVIQDNNNKGIGKGKGAGFVPNPAPKGKSNGKG